GFERGRVDVATADAAGFQCDPAVTALLAVLLQDELAVFAALEIGHLWIGLAETVEEMQHGLTARGQLHLGVDVGIYPEIITQGAVGVHCLFLGAFWLIASSRPRVEDFTYFIVRVFSASCKVRGGISRSWV